MMLGRGARAATVLTAIVLCGCLDSPPAEDATVDAAVTLDAARAFTVVRQPDVLLPDEGGPVEDEVEVEPVCTIAEITVDMNIKHAWRGDVVILLTSPTVRTVTLKASDDVDDADDVIGNYPLTLTPVDSLETFVDLPATGSWTLTVEDVEAGTVGTLVGWALNLTCG